jgi:hypothetical protein
MGRTRATDVLLPARFLLTMGHFIVTVLVVYGSAASVSAGLAASASSATVASATSSLTAAFSISFIAFAIQLGGLILGGTLLFNQLNLFHAVAHFFGGVLTAWFVIGGWGYLSYWCVCVVRAAVWTRARVQAARLDAAVPHRDTITSPYAGCSDAARAQRARLTPDTLTHKPCSASPPFAHPRPIMIIFNLLPAIVEAVVLARIRRSKQARP